MTAQNHTVPGTLEALDQLSEEELSALVGKYPFVALYRVVLAGKMKLARHPQFRDALHHAALHAPDRSRLYQYLHTDIFSTPGAEPVPTEVTPKIDTITPEQKAAATESATELPSEATEPEVKQEVPPLVISGEKEKKKKPGKKKSPKAAKTPKPARKAAVPPVDPAPSLKEAVLRKAAGRQVSLEEKHSFLEWLDILEDPDGFKPAPAVSQEAASEALQEGYVEEAYASNLQREAAQMEEAEADAAEFDELPEVRDLADKSIAMNTGLATETWAKIMLKQGKIHDAIAVYEALRLKYPEKSDYFAALIDDLKER